jgi:hypothetical protein
MEGHVTMHRTRGCVGYRHVTKGSGASIMSHPKMTRKEPKFSLVTKETLKKLKLIYYHVRALRRTFEGTFKSVKATSLRVSRGHN